jgi:hypothetical protein
MQKWFCDICGAEITTDEQLLLLKSPLPALAPGKDEYQYDLCPHCYARACEEAAVWKKLKHIPHSGDTGLEALAKAIRATKEEAL